MSRYFINKILFTCDVCGKTAKLVDNKTKCPNRWVRYEKKGKTKHACNHCKSVLPQMDVKVWSGYKMTRLKGKGPKNLDTVELRKCLLVAPIKHIRGLK